MDEKRAADAATELFISYSHKDASLLESLRTHLAVMRRQGLISDWYDRKIEGGTDVEDEILRNLESAQIILLLVSSDFLMSDYCYEKEMLRALELHREQKAKVIPIILRPVDWHDAPFGKLLALPKDGKPIVKWHNRDEAWVDVVKELKKVIRQVRSNDQPMSEDANHQSVEAGVLLLSGIRLALSGSFVEAVSVLTSLLRLENNNHAAKFYRAFAWSKLKMHAMAIPDFISAYRMVHPNPFGYNDIKIPSDAITSAFSGTGSGTFNHGLGVRPTLVMITGENPYANIAYDSLGSSSIHVICNDIITRWAALAIGVPEGNVED